MPMHTDKEPKKLDKATSWMKSWQVKGNNRADSMADTAAHLHRVTLEYTTPLIQVLDNLSLLQERLIAVFKFLPKKLRNKPIAQYDPSTTQAVSIAQSAMCQSLPMPHTYLNLYKLNARLISSMRATQ